MNNYKQIQYYNTKQSIISILNNSGLCAYEMKSAIDEVSKLLEIEVEKELSAAMREYQLEQTQLLSKVESKEEPSE